MTRLLLALSKLRPLLLILDDVQWADLASLEALLFLCHRLRQQPLLVVLAFRSVEASADTAVWQTLDALDAVGPHLRLHLEPLDLAETAEFINQGLGLRQSAPLFSQRLHAETGGIPLLLLENLRLLHDEGLLYRDKQGRWHMPYDSNTTSYAELHLPAHSPATTTLLERHRRQLPPAAQETLQLAAVMGRDVPFAWLLAASTQPPTETLTALGLLVQRQFLQETPQAYRFSHDKIREGAYAQIPPDQRGRYHRAIAAAIAAGGERRPSIEATQEETTAVSRLAYHYQQGEQWPEALHYTLLAADEARDLHALAMALAGYATARQILAKHHPLPATAAAQWEYRLLISRQPLLFLMGQTAQQAAELAELRQLADGLPDPTQRAEALLKEADFMARVRAEQETAVSLAQQALTLAQQHGLPHLQAEAWGVIGEARHVQGAFQESAVALRQAVALWESQNDEPHRLRNAYLQLLHSERMNGRWAEGKVLADKLLMLATEAGNQMEQANAHSALASFSVDQGEYEAAHRSLDTALTIFRRLGARLHEARSLANLGYVQWARHNYGQGIELQEAALLIFQELNNRKSILLSYLNLATLYFEVGQVAQGEAYVAQGLALAEELQLLNYTVVLHLCRAQALIGQGALTAGGAILDEIAPLALSDEEIHTRAGYWAARGIWLLGHGRYPEAESAFVLAADLFARQESVDFVTAMRSFQAWALWQMGENVPAQALSVAAVVALAQSKGGEFVPEIYWHHSQIVPETRLSYLEKAYNTVAAQAASLPDPAWQEIFWTRPLHQTIRAAWEGQRVQQVQVWLPKLEAAGMGRTAVSQLIAIEWTPTHPDDAQITNKTARRRQQIARLLAEAAAQGGRATSAALAKALGNSESTIKRDLAALQ